MVHGCDALDLHIFKGDKTADQDQKLKQKTGHMVVLFVQHFCDE
jgi:hypothetical protein